MNVNGEKLVWTFPHDVMSSSPMKSVTEQKQTVL